MPQLLTHAFANLDALFDVIVALGAEAVDVHHGQLRRRVRLKERFVPMVQTGEGGDEVDGGRGEVHDEVGDCGRNYLGDGSWFGDVCGRRSGYFDGDRN